MAAVVTFFNNKGGVGKTSLVYHLAWMLAEQGRRIVVADFDPQSNLTAVLLPEESIADLWERPAPGSTVYECLRPLAEVGDIVPPRLIRVTENLHLLPGDVALAAFEDDLSQEWSRSLGDANLYRPMRVLSSFWQVLHSAVEQTGAEMVLVDVGPNLGAINRSALIATDAVVVPLAADLYSLQGLKNLGPELRSWRSAWRKRLENWGESREAARRSQGLPSGTMRPIGYVCQQPEMYGDRPVKAYQKWIARIPGEYRRSVLGQSVVAPIQADTDPQCLTIVKHYRSLIPIAQEHRLPVFALGRDQGVFGKNSETVAQAYRLFRHLADKIWRLVDPVPAAPIAPASPAPGTPPPPSTPGGIERVEPPTAPTPAVTVMP